MLVAGSNFSWGEICNMSGSHFISTSQNLKFTSMSDPSVQEHIEYFLKDFYHEFFLKHFSQKIGSF